MFKSQVRSVMNWRMTAIPHRNIFFGKRLLNKPMKR
jgi:hypothetical protein